MPSLEYLQSLGRLVHVFAAPGAADEDRMLAIGALVPLAAAGPLVLRVAAPDAADDDDPAGEGPDEAAVLGGGALRRLAVRRLVIRRGAGSRELAQFAGLLVRAVEGDAAGGRTLVGDLDALRIWSVHVEFHAVAGAAVAELPPPLRAALDAAAAAEVR